ncbi:MAG: GNAT family N-acetyltransferase [Candidatus Coproplasma sp.]
MGQITLKYNQLTAGEFISLWERVWGGAPAVEQVELALKHTPFTVAAYDNGQAVGMARVIGDMGLDYLIKDVVVRPAYQRKGIGKLLVSELLAFIKDNGVSGTDVFVELCTEAENIPFYQGLGFDENDEHRLKMMCRAR